ncbi:hypothetical protein [Frankia sp. AgB32]|uniref:hypothetical protein n=1 Tax=Frankia sp. AgB32 TaxID=631119 RepID=UPI00200C792D|nr:hypothetical protein [Frankia sp. AgB32]MCK9895758.1 hypothetical protein [Frankia sp. AgB32]
MADQREDDQREDDQREDDHTGDDHTGDEDSQLGGAVELLGRVVAPATALTAVLYFFGYTREKAYYNHFGIDLGTVDFTTTDYLLEGGQVAFAPLATLLTVAAAALTVRPLLDARLARSGARTRKAVANGIAVLAAVLFGVAVAGLLSPAKRVGSDLLAPVALGGAVAAVAYLLTSGYGFGASGNVRPNRASGRVAHTATLVSLAIVAVFWGTSTVGHHYGRTAARSFERNLPAAPHAIVYTHQRIAIHGTGVTREQLDLHDAAYAYRYSGLRVLLHNGGVWFLLPRGWRSRNSNYVALIHDTDPNVRIELAP